MQYKCHLVQGGDTVVESVWETIEALQLKETATGNNTRLGTTVKACWTKSHLHIRFDCEDDYIIANYMNRDEPLYEEDVVEVFLDPAGKGELYFEFELSPNNVVFDAKIAIHDKERAISGQVNPITGLQDYKTIDLAWNAEGMKTSAVKLSESHYSYQLVIPFADLEAKPETGESWSWNAYRIDGAADGSREYAALYSTGAINFHMPHKFGKLLFVE